MDEKKVCILDYKSGNVQSVFNMMLTLTPKVVISNRIKDIISATHIVLPGVGAFGSSMKKIKNKIPLSVLEKEVFKKNKPFLGICVGMQVLAERGYEFGEHKGLGWIPGSVEKMDVSNLPLPHIGWNNISIVQKTPLIEQLDNNQDFYFVHSIYLKRRKKKMLLPKQNTVKNLIQ